jgi:hypothetical protein
MSLLGRLKTGGYGHDPHAVDGYFSKEAIRARSVAGERTGATRPMEFQPSDLDGPHGKNKPPRNAVLFRTGGIPPSNIEFWHEGHLWKRTSNVPAGGYPGSFALQAVCTDRDGPRRGQTSHFLAPHTVYVPQGTPDAIVISSGASSPAAARGPVLDPVCGAILKSQYPKLLEGRRSDAQLLRYAFASQCYLEAPVKWQRAAPSAEIVEALQDMASDCGAISSPELGRDFQNRGEVFLATFDMKGCPWLAVSAGRSASWAYYTPRNHHEFATWMNGRIQQAAGTVNSSRAGMRSSFG